MRQVLLASLALTASISLPAASPKSAPDQTARQAFRQVLDAVNAGWFGKPYQGVTAVDLSGNLTIQLSASAINAKVDSLSQGQLQGGAKQGARVALRLKGTYFANSDFKTEMTGDFGNLLYTRVGNRGFLYSKEQNAYTTRVDLPPSDVPLSFLGWFRQSINDIQAVYADGSVFKASMSHTDANRETLTFVAPTTGYDPGKREQSLAESLGFWKRGRLELLVHKDSHMPQRMTFSNPSQGVRSQLDFTYGGQGGKLQSVTLTNQSRGMEGPGFLRIAYGSDGLIQHLTGELNGKDKQVAFDIQLAWTKGRNPSSLLCVPPPGATRKGREELETTLLVSLAGEILNLQRSGLNLRSVALTRK